MFRCKVSNIKINIIYILQVLPLLVVSIFSKKIGKAFNNNEVLNILSFNKTPSEYIIAASLILIFFFTLLYLFNLLINYSIVYSFEDGRIVYKHGILKRKTEYLEFYRIKDISVSQPIYYRPFNVENIKLITTDRTHPEFLMLGVEGFSDNEKELRKNIKEANQKNRSEIDVV